MNVFRSRVGILFAGGTRLSGSARLRRGVRRASDVAPWVQEMGELLILADIEPMFVLADDSVSPPERWRRIALAIRQMAPRVDGLVVLHEPMTADLTAVALAAMVTVTPKPIVIAVGTNDGQTGGRSNLINAVQTATAHIPAVLFLRGPQILLAAKAMDVEIGPNDTLGRIDFGVRQLRTLQRPTAARLQMSLEIESRVVVVTADTLWASNWAFPAQTKGVVVVWPSSQRVPADGRLDFIKRIPKSVPVVASGWPTSVPVPPTWTRTMAPAQAAMARLMVTAGRRRSTERRLKT